MYCTSTFICRHSISYLKLFASSITIVAPPPFFAATIVCCLRRSLLTSFASLVVRCQHRLLPPSFASAVVRCQFLPHSLPPWFAAIFLPIVRCHFLLIVCRWSFAATFCRRLVPSATVVCFRRSLSSFASVIRCRSQSFRRSLPHSHSPPSFAAILRSHYLNHVRL